MADKARTIEGNSTFDSSVQNNGVVADQFIKSNYASIQINHVNVTVGLTKDTKAFSVPPKTKQHKTELSKLPIAEQKQMASAHALSYHSKCLKLRSRVDGAHVPVYATYDASLGSNWISRKIVGRLGLKAYHLGSPVQAISKGRLLKSAGGCVRLSYSKVRGTQDSQRQEFHVMEEAPFDLLFGNC